MIDDPVNILLVDDHPENLLALEAILGDLGQNLVRATSGFEALRLLLHNEFAVILLDVQMPGMDGFETASLIRQRVKLQHTPIIFLTANDTNETSVFRGYSVGAVDYIFKPFSSDVLKAKVSVFIDLFRKSEEVKRQAELLHRANQELARTNMSMGGLYRELERKNQEIHRERDFISAVLETAGSFVIVLDSDGKIVRFNRACELISGYRLDEVAGKPLWEVLGEPTEAECVRDSVEKILQGEYPLESEIGWTTRDGIRRIIAWSNTLLHETTEGAQYVICTGIDITERKQAEDTVRRLNEDLERRVRRRTGQLERANVVLKQEITDRRQAELEMKRAKEAAETANSAKDRFLAVLSHELRTPLTPVLATIEVLQSDPQLSSDLRVWFDAIRRNVELEAHLIDDLLDLTKIAKGKLELYFDMVDVHVLLRNVIDICLADAQDKLLDVKISLEAAECWVKGDPARLQQVFWNLIKNAVKFTPEHGSIEIRTTNPTEGHLCIEIVDSGIGIEEASVDKIFDAFEQGDKTITRSFGGLGLGLSISKALVEGHGGTITVSSAGAGMGASFSVGLATAIVEPVRASDTPADSIERASRGDVHILIVEDHKETNYVMRLFLERQGYRVSSARTMQKALELAAGEGFDLLISDINLPDGTGIELIRTLRRDRPITAIALSGFGMEEDVSRSKEAGFTEHLVKPVGVKTLQSVIERVMQAQQKSTVRL